MLELTRAHHTIISKCTSKRNTQYVDLSNHRVVGIGRSILGYEYAYSLKLINEYDLDDSRFYFSIDDYLRAHRNAILLRIPHDD